MMMICTMILWWYLQCDNNDIYLQMRTYLQNTDGMYNEVLQISMRWNEKKIYDEYVH